MKVLACDPGKHNFAFALLENGQVTLYGMLKGTMNEINKVESQHLVLYAEWMHILKLCDLEPATDRIIMERFMRRRGGGGKGSVSEFINLSVGMMMGWSMPLITSLVPASQWKNYFKRNYGTNVTKELLDPKDELGMTDHEADAICIGAWSIESDRPKGSKRVPLLDGNNEQLMSLATKYVSPSKGNAKPAKKKKTTRKKVTKKSTKRPVIKRLSKPTARKPRRKKVTARAA